MKSVNKIVVKPNPSATSVGVPSLSPDPVKDIPGNLEELLRIGDLIQPGESLWDDDEDEVRVLLPGVGQPIPGHVIKAGLGAVGQQELTQVPVTVHHNTLVSERRQ